MRALSTLSSLSRSHNFLHSSPTYLTKFTLFFSFSFSSLSSPTNLSNSNPFIIDYLINTFGFSKTLAISSSCRFRNAKGPEKPDSVIALFKEFGFSKTHIRDSVRVAPQILFSNIDKTLKPKLRFFQELGLTGSDLGLFFSKNSSLLTVSLDRKLIPCVEILKEILSSDSDRKYLIHVLRRCNWIIAKTPESRLLPNIAFLKSCGIVNSQLSMLLKRQPSLFVKQVSNLREMVQKLEAMGFELNSRMFVHGLYTMSCMSLETVQKKFERFQSFEFSEKECLEMFRRAPGLLRVSVEKLGLGIEFYMNTIGLERTMLINQPTCLMHSIEKRVIPRYKVLEILKSKKLLKKNVNFLTVIRLPEEEFLDKFISRFTDNAEDLLVAYKGDISDSAEEEESTFSTNHSLHLTWFTSY